MAGGRRSWRAFSRAGCSAGPARVAAQEQTQEAAVVERAVCAMSSGARRGLRYQAIGEEEMSGWAQRKS